MSDNPNIIATDDEGNELSDSDIEVNGLVPGSGGSGGAIETQDDGATVESETTVINLGGGYFALTNPGSGEVKAVIDESAISHDNIADVAKGDHRTDEQIEDFVATVLTAQGNISITHDDANNQINVDTSALNEEEVEDAVAALLSSSGNLAWNYDDANDNLTVSLSGPITGVQIGTSSNPAPGSHFQSVSTGQLLNEIGDAQIQAPFAGLVVPVGPGLGMADAINPANTTTPVSDAIAVVNNGPGEGAVLLPPKVTEAAPVNVQSAISLLSPTGEAEIEFTSTGSAQHGLVFNDVFGVRIGSLLLRGPGADVTTGEAVRFETNQSKGLNFGHITVAGWNNHAMNMDGTEPFRSNLGGFTALDIDTGSASSNVVMRIRPGTSTFFDRIYLQPTDVSTAADSEGIRLVRGPGMVANEVTLDGTVGIGIRASNAPLDVDKIHYEPNGDNSAAAAVVLLGQNPSRVGHVRYNNGVSNYDPDYFYWLDSGNKFHRLGPRSQSAPGLNVVNINADPAGESWYFGPSADIDVNHSGTTEGEVRSLATAGTGNG